LEHAREALDDRKAKSEAARNQRALLQPVKLLEDLAALEDRDADPGVIDAELQRRAAAAAADQHAAVRRIFDGIGDQILSLGARDRSEFDLERAHQVADLETRDRRGHGAGIEPGNIQKRAEDLLDRLQRTIDV